MRSGGGDFKAGGCSHIYLMELAAILFAAGSAAIAIVAIEPWLLAGFLGVVRDVLDDRKAERLAAEARRELSGRRAQDEHR